MYAHVWRRGPGGGGSSQRGGGGLWSDESWGSHALQRLGLTPNGVAQWIRRACSQGHDADGRAGAAAAGAVSAAAAAGVAAATATAAVLRPAAAAAATGAAVLRGARVIPQVVLSVLTLETVIIMLEPAMGLWLSELLFRFFFGESFNKEAEKAYRVGR